MFSSPRADHSLLVATVLALAACSSGSTEEDTNASAEPTPAVPTSETIEIVPELGAAEQTPELSRFERLDLRARNEHTDHLNPARIDADVAGLTLATLIDGPLTPEPSEQRTPVPGLGVLASLPPFQSQTQRSTWPELYSATYPAPACDEGDLTTTLTDDVAAGSRPYLEFRFNACQTDNLRIDGSLLIERPANALQRPTLIGYDSLQLATDTETTLLTGTFTWTGGDDCGVGERRTARLLATHVDDGLSVLLDDLESYTTASSVLHECGDALSANGWRGSIALGPHGVVSVDTPTALTHDWDGLPRNTSEDILFGSHVTSSGLVRIQGDTSIIGERAAHLSLEDTDTRFPDSLADIAVHVQLIENDTISQTFMATLADARNGALSRLTDTDQDSMPDAWELIHGLDPADPTDAGTDLDRDGSSNLDEYIALRDPSDDRDQTDN